MELVDTASYKELALVFGHIYKELFNSKNYAYLNHHNGFQCSQIPDIRFFDRNILYQEKLYAASKNGRKELVSRKKLIDITLSFRHTSPSNRRNYLIEWCWYTVLALKDPLGGQEHTLVSIPYPSDVH